MTRCYPAVIEVTAAGFSMIFPDVPDCASGGATVQEAAQNAADALQAHLDLAEERGDPLPAPHIAGEVEGNVVARLLVRVQDLAEPRDALARLAADPQARRGVLAWTRLSMRRELAHRLHVQPVGRRDGKAQEATNTTEP